MQISLFEEDRERERKSQIYGTPEFRHAYAEYIRSPGWKRLRDAVLARARGRCEHCPKAPSRLTIHHLTYARFRTELLTDLVALCKPCHEIADEKRRQENRRKFLAAGADARRQNAKEGYFKTKYDDDWHDRYWDDPEGMEQEFSDWKEKKDSGDYDS